MLMFENGGAQKCNPLMLQPEQLGRQSPIPGSDPPLGLIYKGLDSISTSDFCDDSSTWC